MTDDFEQRAREAAEKYATGDHSVSFADTHDMAAFIEGTMWARDEMQAEIDHANDIATRMRKAMQAEGYPALCEQAIEQRDQAEAEIERLKREWMPRWVHEPGMKSYADLEVELDEMRAKLLLQKGLKLLAAESEEIVRLKGELEINSKLLEATEQDRDQANTANYDLVKELGQAKADCGYAMPPIDNRMFCHDCERYIEHSKHTAKLNPLLDEMNKLKSENAKLREALECAKRCDAECNLCYARSVLKEDW